MPLPPEEAWFPLKTYGWGWGVPRRWQGWAVIAAFVAAQGGAAALLTRHPGWFIAAVVGNSAGLVAVCWWKGERPRWRWGKDT
jgi:hypothetical protein